MALWTTAAGAAAGTAANLGVVFDDVEAEYSRRSDVGLVVIRVAGAKAAQIGAVSSTMERRIVLFV